MTADLIRRGELSEEDARQHPHFGFLTRALGVAPDVVVSSGRFRVVPGDRAVLCSDGVVNELSQTEMAGAISGNKDVTALTDDLIELVLARGARDNVSVVAAEVVDHESAGMVVPGGPDEGLSSPLPDSTVHEVS